MLALRGSGGSVPTDRSEWCGHFGHPCSGSLRGRGLGFLACVVAWARNLMTKSTPAKPWEESPELFGRRLKEAFAFMNDNYNVEGLSRELPDRVQTLVEADGDRLCK